MAQEKIEEPHSAGTTEFADSGQIIYRRVFRTLRFQEITLAALCVLTFAHALYAWSVGFGNSISDQYGFRQAQTAISVQSILDGGPWFLYYTPIFGPPWSLSYEFPFYQWITALLTSFGHVPIMQAGRLVSIAFFLLMLLAIWQILAKLNVPRVGRLATAILLLTSPIYLFWTRTFLIETSSVALALWYVVFALQATRVPRGRTMVLAAVLGSAAGAEKLTTFVPLFVLVIFSLVLERSRHKVSQRHFFLLGGWLAALPLAITLLWTELANHTNAQNQLYAAFLPSKALRDWVFGHLADRFSMETWSIFYSRILPDTLGVVIAVPLLFAFLPLARRYASYAFFSGGLFLVPMLVFPTLNRIHSYYQTESAYLLSCACGLIVCGLITGRGPRRFAGWALLLLVAFGGITRYYAVYYASAFTNNQTPELIGQQVQRLTRPDQVIIVKGADWNSEIPFYSHRHAIMDVGLSPALLQREVNATAPSQVGDVLLCDQARHEYESDPLPIRFEKIQQRYGVRMSNSYDDGVCLHSTTKPLQATSTTGPMPFLAVLDLPKAGSPVSDTVTVAGWALSVPLVKEIIIEIDGKPVASGKIGTMRPDLVQPYPKYPGHPFNGFAIDVSARSLLPGQHTISVHAILDDLTSHPVGTATVVRQ